MRFPRAIALPFLALVSACGVGGDYGGDGSGDGLSVFNGWARRAGSGYHDHATKTAVFPDGSLVVTGYFTTVAVFGQGSANETLLYSAGDSDIFVARYTADGNLMWARRAGGPLNEEGWDVDVADDGSCLVTGFFKDGAVFGSGEPAEVELSVVDPVETNVFVARYAADGSLMWVAASSASSHSQGRGLGGLPDGSCVVTGVFFGAVTLGPGEPNETTLATEGVAVFVARFAPDGTPVRMGWTRSTTALRSSWAPSAERSRWAPGLLERQWPSPGAPARSSSRGMTLTACPSGSAPEDWTLASRRAKTSRPSPTTPAP
jgi:hypothetical protein